MHTIAKAEVDSRAEWIRIGLDTGEEIRLPYAEWLESGFRAEDEIDLEAWDALRRRSAEACAREAAFRLLAVRQRSREEMRRRLERKGYEDAIVAKVVSELEDRGYLCDERFARARIHDRLLNRPFGRRALYSDLRKRGVDGETANAAIESILGEIPEGEVGMARKAAEHWLRTKGHRYPHAGKRNQALKGSLARAGFGFDVIREVLREMEMA